MPDESEKILKFPDPPPKDPEVLYHCKACDHKITEVMKEKEEEKAKVLPLNLGGIMIYVCPNCYTMQLPEELYEEILRKANSNIIT
jgi:uncharacterized protein with PIN domain